MKILLLIALGGGVGAVGRYLVTELAIKLLGPHVPWGTLAVNIVGSMTMGLIVGVLEHRFVLGTEGRLFLTTGLLGGFTTFSAFSLDAVRLMETEGMLAGGSYIIASVALSVGCLIFGLTLARFISAGVP